MLRLYFRFKKVKINSFLTAPWILLEVMTAFSSLAAQEMQHCHRNKHVSPLLNPFGAS